MSMLTSREICSQKKLDSPYLKLSGVIQELVANLERSM